MRKLLLFTILISGFTFAQNFNFTSENFKNSSDNSKDYIVLEFPGKSKHDLFVSVKKTVQSINSTFGNALMDRFSDIEDEQITFNVVSNNSRMIMLNFSGSNIYHVYTKYELNFKEGKIMIKPIFLFLTNKESNQEYLTNLWNRKESKLSKAVSFVAQENESFIQVFKSAIEKNLNLDW